MNAHADDILVCANLTERSEYPQFTDRQVVTLGRWDRVMGRYVRNVWITDLAYKALDALPWEEYTQAIRPFDVAVHRSGGKVRDARHWQPEEPISILDQLRDLAPSAGRSDEYIAGYLSGVEDAITLITKTLVGSVEVDL